VQVGLFAKNTTQFVEQGFSFRLTVNNQDKRRTFAGMDISVIVQNWDASLPHEKKAALKRELALYINELLLHDFDKLLFILYRVDVAEKKLKQVLAENKEKDAGELIADLLIKRQEEKIAMRQSFPPGKNISDEERW
jgi:hypothetical protein